MPTVNMRVRRYHSEIPTATSVVEILELTTEVNGVTYKHLASLPPEEHIAKVPSSVDDVFRGAEAALLAKVAAHEH